MEEPRERIEITAVVQQPPLFRGTQLKQKADPQRSLMTGPRVSVVSRDAERVAQYFINGGASTGHSHFVGVALSNAARDNNNSTTNSLLETARERPEATPTIPDPNIPGTKAEASMLEMEPVHYPVNRLYASSPVLYSMALPHRRHRYKLPNHALSRMVVGSPHIVRNLIAHRYFHHPIYRGLLNKNFYASST
ncbi:hypothetical protein EAI_09330 [Harpegnathos saltator]|uniref:Uncharacterized protein n=1 Tax=Harpegnathos saltator TaxID=610380 RepID=E2B3V3_HARSA|nr:hypothetical protein EAI_09330 [Harpegnathos saltator]